MPQPSTLAIIPVYKDYAQRDRCVESLRKQSTPVKVFQHDNTETNIGFTKAINAGLREALRKNFRFAMPINQDCYPLPGVVENFERFMNEHPRCAIAGCKELKVDDPDQILFAGGGSPYPASEHFVGRKSRGNGAVSRRVRWVNGACLFVRVDALAEFGLMDENMFLVGSDSDWCFTARARGWEVWYCAEAEVLHERGVTGRVPSLEQQLIYDRDMHYWRSKWFGTLLHRKLDREVDPPRLDQASTIQLLHAGLEHHKATRPIDAEIAYQQVLETNPANDDALHLLGVLHLQNGLIALAVDHLRRAVALRPDIANYHLHLGMALRSAQMTDEARREFSEAVRLGAQSPDVLQMVASQLDQIGEAQEAQRIREQLAALPTP